MSAEALPVVEAPKRARTWKNPFVIAFVVGVVTLTVLPLLQRQMLHAPAPLAALPTFSLPTLPTATNSAEGPNFGTSELNGKPWLANFIPATCDAACSERLTLFAGAAKHLADLKTPVELVSFVQPGAPVSTGTGAGGGRLLAGTAEAQAPILAVFVEAWQKQGGLAGDIYSRPAFAVVDGRGSVRGFWPADEAGRGHAISAARMFARFGGDP